MGRKSGTPLSREDVIHAAIRCIAQDGSEALGINRVAKALGIRPPSLYHHVASNDDLSRLVAIEGWRRLRGALVALPNHADPAVGLSLLATAFRRFVKEHPGLYRVMTETLLAQEDPDFKPIASALIHDFAQVLAPCGLKDDDLIHAVRMLRSTLHGFVSLELGGQFGMPQSVEESFDWVLSRLTLVLDCLPTS